MAKEKYAYVRISEHGKKVTNLVHDWKQEDAQEENLERKGKLFVGEIKKWDIESDTTRTLLRQEILEIVSADELEELQAKKDDKPKSTKKAEKPASEEKPA